eukprot:TRINITY_DN13975_c3_g1_i1.p1 TRINITY_DN13975_c3_g1~~TRINITY_DN13975_c3_g1_i1.p1  ORF type:complete len:529 (+),score=177.65 TRINITY_DN13975_c3_g1_i1:121-1587(+)
MALGKVLAGVVSGLPGYVYVTDRVVQGLEFLCAPSEEEIRQAEQETGAAMPRPQATKKRGGTQQQQQQHSVVKLSPVPSGQSYYLPFFMELMVLCNCTMLMVWLAPLRALWSTCVFHSTHPAGQAPSLYFAPADAATLVVFFTSVALLLWLQRACYSMDDPVGMAGAIIGIASAIAAYGVVLTEEMSPLPISLKEAHAAYVSHSAVAESTMRWFLPPYLLQVIMVSLVCVAISYGCTSATWRLLRCHYQLSDRYAQALSTVEEKRAHYLVNFKVARANNTAPPPPPEYSPSGYMLSFVNLLLSWVTLVCPIAVTASFLVPAAKGHPQVKLARLLLCSTAVATRLLMVRPYLQTYLLRDNEEASRQGDKKKWADAMFQVSNRALMLILRAALVLLAPATSMMALVAAANRLGTDTELWPAGLVGRLVGDAIPAGLMAHEFRAVEDIPPTEYWQQLVSLLTFWLCASESLFIVLYAGYRWVLRFLQNSTI